jgi:hypothetical protein
MEKYLQRPIHRRMILLIFSSFVVTHDFAPLRQHRSNLVLSFAFAPALSTSNLASSICSHMSANRSSFSVTSSSIPLEFLFAFSFSKKSEFSFLKRSHTDFRVRAAHRKYSVSAARMFRNSSKTISCLSVLGYMRTCRVHGDQQNHVHRVVVDDATDTFPRAVNRPHGFSW